MPTVLGRWSSCVPEDGKKWVLVPSQHITFAHQKLFSAMLANEPHMWLLEDLTEPQVGVVVERSQLVEAVALGHDSDPTVLLQDLLLGVPVQKGESIECLKKGEYKCDRDRAMAVSYNVALNPFPHILRSSRSCLFEEKPDISDRAGIAHMSMEV